MPRDPTPTSWSARAAEFAVVALPAAIALERLAHQPSWREDAAVLRDLALIGTGIGGGISTAGAQLLQALPLGTTSFRGALVAVLALAVAGRAGYAIALRLVRSQGAAVGRAPSWFAPAFAAIGVVGASLAPSLQLEATVIGGATTAIALVLVALALALRATDPSAEAARGRDMVAAGALLGAAAAERPQAAMTGAVALMALLFTHRAGAWAARRWGARGPAGGPRLAAIPGRALALGGVVAVAVAGLALAPALLRPLAPRAALDLGSQLGPLPGGDAAALATTALGAWVLEMGWVPLALALLGVVVLLARTATRPGATALLALVVLDVALPARLAGGVVADPAAASRGLAIIAIAIAAAVGLHESVGLLLRARVPYARPAAALLVALQATVVALASEQASEVADRRAQRGGEEWLDASRRAMEARSVALVRDVPKAVRLWAAQLTGGYRPDVLVAPVALLARGAVAADLLAHEPASHALVRSIALRGAPDEFALSELADVRRLHTEADRSWDARVASHVRLDGVWLEMDPQPIGRTDRKRSSADSMAPLGRVLAVLAPTEAPDPATRDVVATTLREQALVLASLGEIDSARALATSARELGPTSSVGSPAAVALLAALEATAPRDPRSTATVPVRRTGQR